MAEFEDSAWSTPESDLEAGPFCSICMIDVNPTGEEKIKSKCHLPVRKRPGAPINRNAIRNAMGRIFQVKGISEEERRKGARKLYSLAKQAGVEVTSSAFLSLAGKRK